MADQDPPKKKAISMNEFMADAEEAISMDEFMADEQPQTPPIPAMPGKPPAPSAPMVSPSTSVAGSLPAGSGAGQMAQAAFDEAFSRPLPPVKGFVPEQPKQGPTPDSEFDRASKLDPRAVGAVYGDYELPDDYGDTKPIPGADPSTFKRGDLQAAQERAKQKDAQAGPVRAWVTASNRVLDYEKEFSSLVEQADALRANGNIREADAIQARIGRAAEGVTKNKEFAAVAQKQAEAIFSTVAKDFKESTEMLSGKFFREQEGVRVVDAENITKYVNERLVDMGLMDSNGRYNTDIDPSLDVKHTLASRLMAEAENHQRERVADQALKAKLGERRIAMTEDVAKSFSSVAAVEAQLSAEAKNYSAGAKADVSKYEATTVNPAVTALKKTYDGSVAHVNAEADRINKLYEAGQITYEQANQAIDQANQGLQQATDAYNSGVDQLLKSSNEEVANINFRWNSKFKQEQESRFAAFEKSQEAFQEEFRAKYGDDSNLIRELNRAYNDAWQKQAEKEDTNKGKERAAYERYMKDVPGVRQMNRFYETFDEGLGGWYKTMGVTLGSSDMYDAGVRAENKYMLPERDHKGVDDLLTVGWLETQGRLAGRMFPNIVATGLTAAATAPLGGVGGAATATRLAVTAARWGLSGGVGYVMETSDIAAQMRMDVLDKTGDIVKANKAADRVWEAQTAIAWSYLMEGAPFLKLPFAPKSRILGGLMGFGAEFGQEFFLQEGPQQMAEKRITAEAEGKRETITEGIFQLREGLTAAYDDFYGGIKEMAKEGVNPRTGERQPSELEMLAVDLSGMGLLGVPGGVMSASQARNAKADMLKSYAADEVVAKYAEYGDMSWLNSLVEKRGAEFASELADVFRAAGQLDVVQHLDLKRKIESVSKAQADASSAKLMGDQKDAYTAIAAKVYEHRNAAANAESEISRKTHEARASEAEKMLIGIATGKDEKYFMVEHPNGKKVFMTETEGRDMLNDFESFQTLTMLGMQSDGGVKITAYGAGNDVVLTQAWEAMLEWQEAMDRGVGRVSHRYGVDVEWTPSGLVVKAREGVSPQDAYDAEAILSRMGYKVKGFIAPLRQAPLNEEDVVDVVTKEPPTAQADIDAAAGTTGSVTPQAIRAEGEVKTLDNFQNENEFYRVIVGDEAFNDIVDTGAVRTNADSKVKPGATLAEKLAARPTAFPSFSKGSASIEYAEQNPNNYIIVTSDPSIKPSTSGRHGKGSTMFPTDENGNPLAELSGEKIKVYKHIGNNEYVLVYENGKVVSPTATQADIDAATGVTEDKTPTAPVSPTRTDVSERVPAILGGVASLSDTINKGGHYNNTVVDGEAETVGGAAFRLSSAIKDIRDQVSEPLPNRFSQEEKADQTVGDNWLRHKVAGPLSSARFQVDELISYAERVGDSQMLGQLNGLKAELAELTQSIAPRAGTSSRAPASTGGQMTVKSFADDIAAGKKMDSPEAVQFYENNKKEIEAELQRMAGPQKQAPQQAPVDPNDDAEVTLDEDVADDPDALLEEAMGTPLTDEEIDAEMANIAKSVSGTDTEVIDLDQDGYAKAAKDASGDTSNSMSEGFFIGKDRDGKRRIYINRDMFRRGLMAHEGTHAIVFDALSKDPKAKKIISNSAKQALGASPGAKKVLLKFLENYGGAKTKADGSVDVDATVADPELGEEVMSEFVAALYNGSIKLDNAMRQFIRDMYNRIMAALGVSTKVEFKEDGDFIAAAKQIASAMKAGRKIKTGGRGADVTGPGSNIVHFSKTSYGSSGFVKEPALDSKEYNSAVKSGRISIVNPYTALEGKVFAMTLPDDHFTGTFSMDGKHIADGNGGVFYVAKYGESGGVWASAGENAAYTFVRQANSSLEQNGGDGRVVIVKGSDTKHATSLEANVAWINMALAFAEKSGDTAGLISAIKSVYDVGTAKSPSSIRSSFEQYLSYGRGASGQRMADAKSTFDALASSMAKDANPVITKMLVDMGLDSPSMFDGTQLKKDIKKITAKGIKEAFGVLLQEDFLAGLKKGSAYAALRFTSPLIVEEDPAHPSYPYAIKTADGSPSGLDIFDRSFMVYADPGTPVGDIAVVGRSGGKTSDFGQATTVKAEYRIDSSKAGNSSEQSLAEGLNKYGALSKSVSEADKPKFSKKTPATQGDFKKGKIKDLLDKKDWVIMTAENPSKQKLSDAKNASRMKSLMADLDAMGAKYTPVDGKYGNEEKSLAITGVNEKQAIELGKKYGQESVLTNKGLVYQDGTYNPATGVSELDTKPDDFYSVVNGQVFQIDIDFDKKLSSPKFSKATPGKNLVPADRRNDLTDDGKGNYVFFHKGPKSLKGGKINPSYFGSGKSKDNRSNPVMNYYTKPDQGERMISGDVTYAVPVPKWKVYPLMSDPLDLYDKAEANFRKKFGKDQAFDAVRQADFIGPLAEKAGFDMMIAGWSVHPLRAESGKALKPDAKLTKKYEDEGVVDLTKSVDPYYEKLMAKARADRDKQNAKEAKGFGGPKFSKKTDQAFDGKETPKTPIGDTKTVTVDGKERTALNSNGKPIHPTVEGVRNFWRFYKGPKDKQGRPLVVYHATHANIDAFKRTRGAHIGFHFGDIDAAESRLEMTTGERMSESDKQEFKRLEEKYQEARSKAGDYEETLRGRRRQPTDEEQSAILDRIKRGESISAVLEEYEYKPTQDELTALSELKAAADQAYPGRAFASGANIGAYYISTGKLLRLPDVGDWASVKKIKGELPWDSDATTMTELADEISSRGYGGIVYLNAVEYAGVPQDSYIVFSPTQIKSATGNYGSFDPSSPNIKFSGASPENIAKALIAKGYNTKAKAREYMVSKGADRMVDQVMAEFDKLRDAAAARKASAQVTPTPPATPTPPSTTRQDGGGRPMRGSAKRMKEQYPELYAALGEDTIYYDRMPMTVTRDAASELVGWLGLERAKDEVLNRSSDIPDAVRAMMGRMVMKQLADEHRLAELDTFAENFFKLGTSAGQFINALRDVYEEFSKDMIFYRIQRIVEKEVEKKKGKDKNYKKLRDGLTKVNKEVAEEVIRTRKVRDKATDASFPKPDPSKKPKTTPAYGSTNKGVKKSQHDQAWRELNSILPSGVVIPQLVTIAAYHIEAGSRSFAAVAERVIAKGGRKLLPYLKGSYKQAAKDMGIEPSTDAEIDEYINKANTEKIVDKLRKAIKAKDKKSEAAAIAALQQVAKDDGLWGKYRKEAVSRLTRLADQDIKDDIQKDTIIAEFTAGLVRNITDQMKKEAEAKGLESKEPKTPKPAIEIIGDAYRNFDKYEQVWKDTQSEWKRRLNAAEARLAKATTPEAKQKAQADIVNEQSRLDRLDAYYGELMIKPFSEAAIGRAVKDGMKELDQKIDDIIRQHYTVYEAAKQTLADKLVQGAGLTEVEAAKLADAVKAEFERLATERKKALVEQYAKRKFGDKKVTKTEKKGIEDELIFLTNTGAFGEADFINKYGELRGWPKLTDKNIKEIERLADRIQTAPPGRPRLEAIEDLLGYQENLSGVSKWEVAQSVWFANLLSGFETQEVNFLSNQINLAMEVGVAVSKSTVKGKPMDAVNIVRALGYGFARGWYEAGAVMSTGYSPIRGRVDIPPALERYKFPKYLGMYNGLKMVRRVMVAADVLGFEPLKELRAYQYAAMKARSVDPSPIDRQRALDILNRDDDTIAGAKQQAEDEYQADLKAIEERNLTAAEKRKAIAKAERDKNRRAFELVELARDPEVIQESARFAARATYNYTPEGTLGAVAKGVNMILRELPALRYVVPFVNIIANVTNEALNYYAPVGIARAIAGGSVADTIMGRANKGMTEDQKKMHREDLVSKAVIGLVLQAAVLVLSEPGDDDDPLIEITANGYNNYKQNSEMESKGLWKPYSFRIRGTDTWISYQYTPLLFAFGLVGHLRDATKYRKEKMDDSAMTKYAVAMQRNIGTITDASFLATTADALGWLNDTKEGGLDGLARSTAKTVKAMVVPYSALLNQIQQNMDSAFGVPKMDTRGSLTAELIKNTPVAYFVRDKFPIMVDALGDPIIPSSGALRRFATTSDPDPSLLQKLFISAPAPDRFWRLMVDKKYPLSAPNPKTVTVYDTSLDKERILTEDELFTFYRDRGSMIKTFLNDNFEKLSELNNDQFAKAMSSASRKATTIAKAKATGVELENFSIEE